MALEIEAYRAAIAMLDAAWTRRDAERGAYWFKISQRLHDKGWVDPDRRFVQDEADLLLRFFQEKHQDVLKSIAKHMIKLGALRPQASTSTNWEPKDVSQIEILQSIFNELNNNEVTGV